MKPLNLFSKLLISAMVLMILVSSTIYFASASTAEQKFLFHFKPDPTRTSTYSNMHTLPTYKENDSPMYIFFSDAESTSEAYLWIGVRAVDEKGNFHFINGKYSYQAYVGQKRYIKTIVSQDYDYYAISAQGARCTAKGFWSVDSVIGEEGVFSEEDYLQEGKPINKSPTP